MRRVFGLYSNSVGKKISMAVTGIVLFGFVFVHMIGNLKIFEGPEKYDAYAHFLRTVGAPALGEGQALWIFRIVLLAAVGVHVLAAAQLTLQSWRARGTPYKVKKDLSFDYASRTMRWGGVILAAFVIYHLMHLTFGTAHHDFSDSVYRNVVSGFQRWPVSLAYIVAMVPLALHVYHGLWSATQTLALDNPRIEPWRRPVAAGIALVLAAGNVSMPVAVMAGIVK
jgi:succinate dehydrogenase / fumarate reductase cytochrome b subunit